MTSSSDTPEVSVLPLTYDAFRPYGQVIQGFRSPEAAPKGINGTPANQGTACKYHRLAKVEESYPAGSLVRGGLGIGVASAQPVHMTGYKGLQLDVNVLERHPCTTQAFIPLARAQAPAGAAPSSRQLQGAYLVFVALNGRDDTPDMSTARAFLATAAQGVSYDAGVWHHSLLVVDAPLDVAVVEAQIGGGAALDIEMQERGGGGKGPWARMVLEPWQRDADIPSSVPDTISTTPAEPETNGTAPGPHVLQPQTISLAAFAPYGQLITALSPSEHPAGPSEVFRSPNGLTTKLSRMAAITQSYDPASGAQQGISVMRSTPKIGLERGKVFDVRFMERHPYTSQAFLPMGKGEVRGRLAGRLRCEADAAQWAGKGEPALSEGGQMLVLVADNGADDRPDPSTIKAFIVPSSVGINYAAGTWRESSALHLLRSTGLYSSCIVQKTEKTDIR